MRSAIRVIVLFFLIGSVETAMGDEIIEIRTYTLKDGRRIDFHSLVEIKVLPLLAKWKMEVVAYGKSMHDENTYYLIRSFADLDHLNQSEEAFYTSEDWVNGPKEAILALIESYKTLILPKSVFSLLEHRQADDRATLSALNARFIKNFVTQDTVAHNEIIHTSFVCIENDGAIVDRKEYMKAWSHAYSDGKFTSFSYRDEVIRIFGNTALIRSKTDYQKIRAGKEIRGSSVYTDTYVKINGRWWCVQAQITPVKY